MYKIPLFNLNFDSKELEAVKDTLESKWISLGPRCNEFEKLFSEKIGSQFSLSTSSCTASLHLALISINIKNGDEVIVPSLTFAATANVIKYLGAKPVFCDITSASDLTIDPEDVKRKVTDKTKAIIVMHYAGFSCNMDRLIEISRKHNLFLIEDAAHAPLSEYKNKKLGTIGDIGTFSFFSNKNIAIGEGGMITTKHESIYKKLKLLRSHGMTTLSYERSKGHSTSYEINEIGYNYRLDDIRASIGIIQLQKLDNDISKRKNIRKIYINEFKDQSSLIIPFKNHKHLSSNYIFPLVLKNSDSKKRDYIRNELHSKGIQTSIHYPAVHRFQAYTSDYLALPITDYVSNNEITLPMYGSLTENNVRFIATSLIEILKKNDK